MFTSIVLARLRTKILNFSLNLHFREDSVVGIATRYGLDDVGVELRAAIDLSLLNTRPGWPWGPQNLHNWYRIYFQGVTQPESGVEHQLPLSAEVRNEYI